MGFFSDYSSAKDFETAKAYADKFYDKLSDVLYDQQKKGALTREQCSQFRDQVQTTLINPFFSPDFEVFFKDGFTKEERKNYPNKLHEVFVHFLEKIDECIKSNEEKKKQCEDNVNVNKNINSDLGIDLVNRFIGIIVKNTENRTLSSDKKEAVIYGFLIDGATDYISQRVNENDEFWFNAVEFGIESLGLPDEFASFVIKLHSKMAHTEESYKLITLGGDIARAWINSNGDVSLAFSLLSGAIEENMQNTNIPNSIGHLAIKYKLI